MSQSSDERFQELAMKLVSFECSAEEKTELRRLIDQQPSRREELRKLCLAVGTARELLPLANALEATEGRMSVAEMGVFKSELARRREEKLRQTGAPPTENSGGGNEGPPVIDAEIVPEKPFDGYKLGFFALLLLILVAGCVLVLKSCDFKRKSPVGVATPPPASGSDSQQVDARVQDATPARPQPEPIPQQPSDLTPRPNPDGPTSSPATATQLKDYRGKKWVKLADGNAKPGSSLYFRQFVGLNRTSPMVEGMRAPNGGVPNTFMLFWQQGDSWQLRSYPSVPIEARLVVPVDPTRIVVADLDWTEAYLIENDQVQEINVPQQLRCIAAHMDSKGELFLHSIFGRVWRVSGTSGEWMEDTDSRAYVHEQGKPTGMPRGFVRIIRKADSGETVGIFFRHPPNPAMGPAAMVHYKDDVWQLVCSLGPNYPGSATHYLSGNSMVAALGDEFLVVKKGMPRTIGLPDDVNARGPATWRALRAASTDEFVAVQSSGAVYHYINGRFDRQVSPHPAFQKDGAWQGDGAGGLRSVLITPQGTIYAIQSPTRWSQSVIYQLVPQ